MKLLLFLGCVVCFVSLAGSLNCSTSNCSVVGGICNKDVDECICFSGYATVPQKGMPFQKCNYRQINRWIPVVLEVILPSVGHFYVGNFYLGLVKMLLFLLPLCCVCFCFESGVGAEKNTTGLSENDNNESNSSYVFSSVIIFLFGTAFCIMTILDPVIYALGWYTDGNGISFL